MTEHNGQDPDRSSTRGQPPEKPALTAARLRYAVRGLGRGAGKGMGPRSPGVAHLGATGVVCVSLHEIVGPDAEPVRAAVESELLPLVGPCAQHRVALYTLDAYGELAPVDVASASEMVRDPYEVGAGVMVTALVPYQPGWRDLDRLRGIVATHAGQTRSSGAARGPARALWSFLLDPDATDRPEHATSVRRLPVEVLVAMALLAAPRDLSRQRAAGALWDIKLTPRDVADLAPHLPAFRRCVAALFSGALDAPVLPVDDLETLLEAQLKRTNPAMMVGTGAAPFVTGAAGFRAATTDLHQRAVDAVDALHERSPLEPAARARAVALGTPGLVDPRAFGW